MRLYLDTAPLCFGGWQFEKGQDNIDIFDERNSRRFAANSIHSTNSNNIKLNDTFELDIVGQKSIAICIDCNGELQGIRQ